jgi:hypothetical protein
VYTVVGSHTVNICTASLAVQASAIVPNVIVSNSLDICSGHSGTLTASGATTYSWSGVNTFTNGFFVVSPMATTLYTLVANTQNTVGPIVNCPTTETILVTVNPNPTIMVTAQRQIICKGETNTLTATGASTYSWSSGSETGSVVTISPNLPTIYTITGTNEFGCESTLLFQANVNNCNSIFENENMLQTISVFPNPNKGTFTVKVETDLTLRLMNNLGQVIKVFSLDSKNNHSITIENLSHGIYFLVGENKSGKVNQKIVISN